MSQALSNINQKQNKTQLSAHPAGLLALESTGELLPQSTLDSIKRTGLAIKGPTTTPVSGGHRSLNVTLRQKFDLYANLGAGLVGGLGVAPKLAPKIEASAEQLRALQTLCFEAGVSGRNGDKSDKMILSVLRIRKIIQGLLLFSRDTEADPKASFHLSSLLEEHGGELTLNPTQTGASLSFTIPKAESSLT